MSNKINESERVKKTGERVLSIINIILTDSGKTDIDSQIKAIETLNKNLINSPLFISIVSSLKELRGIKRNQREIKLNSQSQCSRNTTNI